MAGEFVKLSRGVRFEIDDRAISSMTLLPTGLISRHYAPILEEIKVEAVKRTIRAQAATAARVAAKTGTFKVPAKNQKRLADDYSVFLANRSNSRVTWNVRNNRSYAAYVFRGTKGPITAGGRIMPIGKSRMGLYGVARIFDVKGAVKTYGVRFKRKVRGQRAKNHPFNAMQAVLRKRGALR